MTNNPSSEILTQLRAKTAMAHRQLEDQIDIAKVCADRESYVRLLERFLCFFEPLEHELRRVPGWKERGFCWSQRAKTPMLLEDLSILGRTEAQLASLPRCTDLPELPGLAEAFGCAYVLEGSTLGGRHIMGVLAQSPVPEEARHYFSSYGENVAACWREFCAMLTGFPNADAGAMTATAVKTFDKFGAWLNHRR